MFAILLLVFLRCVVIKVSFISNTAPIKVWANKRSWVLRLGVVLGGEGQEGR